ncbi:LAFE_0E08218g1_1 [Lachancea fermentati]|uniref:E3 ubiquitin protein ligase n=1 Tax=Lachancea fermentati TaxID=4955 RepID=A0A1G4MD68_LACFM|nr:LAFE_0E08218g1_1 [Lachancea fermentati]
MSSEPPVKKQKLELSDPTEPLTQRDVIAFQKEALFRCINTHRSKEESLSRQYEVCQSQSALLRENCAKLRAIVVTLAKTLSELCSDDDTEAKELCATIINGDENQVAASANDFCTLLGKHLSTAVNEQDSGILGQLHKLDALKIELASHNEQLRKEVGAIKSYYQDVIRKYDREDSATVKRVFKDSDKAEEENQDLPNTEPEQAKVKVEEEEDTVSKLEHEIELQKLNSEIEVLRSNLKDLETWKTKNEQELIKLRTELATLSSSKDNNLENNADREALYQKVKHLTDENNELAHANDAYLTKFQSLVQEREIFSNKLSTEFQTAQDALKKHNATLEKDLVRIRATRDELLSKVAVLESQKSKSEILNDVNHVLDLQKEQVQKMELRMDSKSHEGSQDALMKELQDLEKAFKEVSQLSLKKYSDYVNHESIISKLTVEKTKADQKYYAAMRSKDSILIENKNLSKNLHKSNELISQLKDLERNLQLKIENLNKQMQLSQNNEKRLIDSNKSTSLKIMDLTSQLSKTKKAAESSLQDKSKLVGENTRLESQVHTLETENNTLKLKLSHADNKAKKLHESLLSNGGDNAIIAEELENFRTVVYCSLCSKNWKDTAIKTCGHVFCADCCKERLASRMRKCPTCNKGFSGNDLLVVHL